MQAGGLGRFEQAYNDRAAGSVSTSRKRPTTRSSWCPRSPPIARVKVTGEEVLIDSGLVSKKAFTQLERAAQGQPTGLTVLAAEKRERHGGSRMVAQLEARSYPAPPPAAVPFLTRLAQRTVVAADRTSNASKPSNRFSG